MTLLGAHGADEGPYGLAVGRHDISKAQARAEAFGQAANMPGQIRRYCRKRRRTLLWNEAIGIILDDRQLIFAGDGRDFLAPTGWNRQRQRVLQCRIEIERLRLQPFAGAGKGVRQDTVLVHRQAGEVEPQLCSDRAHAGIGDDF